MPSTAPITGSTPGKIRTFLLDHERLIIIVIGALLIFGAYVKIENIIAAHDKANLQQAQIVADAQKAANVQLAQQVATDALNLKALEDKLESQNQQLVNANATLTLALANRQRNDATLSPSELGTRWSQLVPAATPTVVPGGLQVSQAGATSTVQALEQVPVLTEQLKNETAQKTNDDQIIAQQTTSIGTLNLRVDGLNKTIVDNDKVCQDTIKVVKDDARKSKRRWFLIGFVSGFVSRQLLGHGL